MEQLWFLKNAPDEIVVKCMNDLDFCRVRLYLFTGKSIAYFLSREELTLVTSNFGSCTRKSTSLSSLLFPEPRSDETLTKLYSNSLLLATGCSSFCMLVGFGCDSRGWKDFSKTSFLPLLSKRKIKKRS